ncbi:group II intron reverse transcriptase/maturase [Guptibacillus hwajinpoensis]|uniref:group II intron reverse transcriptase/maturase n=1 Tax=Guptibacillus hwajinpoensis TaxID=208199 RepID=UPI003734C8A7
MKRKYPKGRLCRHTLKGESPRNSKSANRIHLDAITDKKNLYEAFRKVKENKGKPGIDKVTSDEFERDLGTNLDTLQSELIKGRYSPRPLRKLRIPQWNNKPRQISIPTVRDRVAQQAVLNVIQDDIEAGFYDCSFGYRKGIGAHDAIKSICDLIAEGNHWIVKGDIKGCFDNIPHSRLLELCSNSIKDREITSLLKKMITAGLAAPDDHEQIQSLGTPQGAVISPLLANLYLHQLDAFAVTRGFNLVRYADDWLMLFKTQEEAQAAATKTLGYIKGALGLTSEVKGGADTVSNLQQEFTFLGYTFFPGGMKPSQKSQKKLIATLPDKIHKHLKETENVHKSHTIELVAGGVNPVLKGWYDYYSLGGGKKIYRTIDKEVRKIVRHVARDEKHHPVTNTYMQQRGLLSLESFL